jgi:hypothetical protein
LEIEIVRPGEPFPLRFPLCSSVFPVVQPLPLAVTRACIRP